MNRKTFVWRYVLDKLEEAYQKSGDKPNVLRIGDESDKIAEQVDVETHASRQFLLSLVNKSVHLKNNVAMATESQSTNTQQPAQEILLQKIWKHPCWKMMEYKLNRIAVCRKRHLK